MSGRKAIFKKSGGIKNRLLKSEFFSLENPSANFYTS